MASLDPTITVDVPTIKLKVRFPPLYRFRIRMAAMLIGLAHHVAGSAADIVVETEAADEASPGGYRKSGKASSSGPTAASRRDFFAG